MTSLQQRAELHRQIWQIANDVRGSVDGRDFKQYVLGAFFTASSVKILSVTLTPEMKKGKRSISDNDRQPCNSGLSELNE